MKNRTCLYISAVIALLACASALFADGKVFSRARAKVTIPDQSALIRYADGEEYLAIETRFVGEGKDFAWVIPLPAEPKIEPVTRGLFPTLRYDFAPRVISRVEGWWFFPAFILLAVILWRTMWWKSLAILLFVFLIVPILMPSLGRHRGGMGEKTAGGVDILQHNVVGDYEATVIRSDEPGALLDWLKENGYEVSPAVEPVVADYVKENWVFVAVKLARPEDHKQTSTPHPLGFIFKTDKPVYPLRLTGVENGSLSVDLYVFADKQAQTTGFELKACRQRLVASAGRWKHAEIQRILGGHENWVATKLSGKLTEAELKKDAYLTWAEPENYSERYYTHDAADAEAFNWAVAVFCATALPVFLFRKPKQWMQRGNVCWMIVCLILSYVSAQVAYFALPKAEVAEISYWSGSRVYDALNTLAFEHHESVGQPVTVEWARAAIADLKAGKRPTLLQAEDSEKFAAIPEEDSPGRYTVRAVEGGIEFVTYPDRGGEEARRIPSLSDWELRRLKLKTSEPLR